MNDTADLVGVLRAAGETTRLRLLALLADGEQSVKDLTEILGQSQPRVSRHLKLLADAGLITRNAEGAWAYYGLAPEGAGGDLARWLIGRLSPDDADRSRDRQRLATVRLNQAEQAAAYFATVADSWDLLRSLHVPEEAVEAAIVEAMQGRVVDTLIDLGTGTGRMLELLAGHYRRGIGIDASREMIAVARAKLAACSIGHAQVRLGDIADLDAGAGRADVIVVHQVLHYFDDPGRVLAQARRALKPGGEMLIVDFAPHGLEFLRSHHAHRRLGLSEAQMAGWARAADLKVTELKSFPPSNPTEGLTVCLWRLTDETDNAT
ncbi:MULTISPECIES: metalloregulator ArsR/SmtB family transcription factor [unclassified Devosia]|jgi:ubiquinone/menaquinone biosynthesis C-methylase UbiE|uniref:ArsR/SmtB family transcription factor n=1 Tax=unclassified Devosia TaxID=196773 RepID=UPI00086AE027|nr:MULTISPECIES: metalloregulator ArsR/SmtB family transcription factor [unclassified Devosia]MBN9363797.1 metalloregulator ArsR/SmtB family transcription factor [Devosia sp.]ODS83012.1 MAG: ArsR family transcriptional regulator [Devosia sp. SCN 66-27]OJX27083.1 MAG: ArsR family transcriptional regulator [Devosia sp. 66-14]